MLTGQGRHVQLFIVTIKTHARIKLNSRHFIVYNNRKNMLLLYCIIL